MLAVAIMMAFRCNRYIWLLWMQARWAGVGSSRQRQESFVHQNLYYAWEFNLFAHCRYYTELWLWYCDVTWRSLECWACDVLYAGPTVRTWAAECRELVSESSSAQCSPLTSLRLWEGAAFVGHHREAAQFSSCFNNGHRATGWSHSGWLLMFYSRVG